MEAAYKLIRQIQQGMISFGPSCQKAPSPTLIQPSDICLKRENSIRRKFPLLRVLSRQRFSEE